MLWLLALVLALGTSSSSAQYVGLCEYHVGLAAAGPRARGRDTEDPGLAAWGNLRKVTRPHVH